MMDSGLVSEMESLIHDMERQQDILTGQQAEIQRLRDENKLLRAAIREAIEILEGDGEYPETAKRMCAVLTSSFLSEHGEGDGYG